MSGAPTSHRNTELMAVVPFSGRTVATSLLVS